MTSVSDILVEVGKELDKNPTILTKMHFAALWLSQRLRASQIRLSLLTKANTSQELPPELKNEKETSEMLFSLVTGTYLSKWFSPTTHQAIVELASSQKGQLFFFDELVTLTTVPGFQMKDQKVLLEVLMARQVVTVNAVNVNGVGLLQELKDGLTIDPEFLEMSFKSNHWLLVFFFALNAYKLYGFDSQLFIDTIQA